MIRFSDAEFDQLAPEQQDAYIEYLESEVTAWKLTPRQQIAEDLTRSNFIVGYGGAAGGGKSDWGLWHVYHYCRDIPKSRWLILRTKLPELKRSLIPRSREKFDDRLATYRQSGTGAGEWTFNNGSVIEFGYMNSDDDVYQYKSAEYDGVFIDESTEVSKFAMRYLMSRIRIVNWRKKAFGAWPHMILCTNPGGPGHAWFKEDLVLATNHGETVSTIRFEDPLTGNPILDPTTGAPIERSIAFVPAFVDDNPHMPEEYKLNLLMLNSTEMRQLLLGDWDVFAGQFFSDWRHDTHVIRPFNIPESWPRVRALDFGTRNPYCCLWAAIDWDSNIYVYRETYQAGLNALQQAQQVVAASRMVVDGRERPEKFQWSNADPAVFKREGSGKNVAQQWAEGGLRVRPAKNDRIGGWSLVRQALVPQPGLEWDFELDGFVSRARLRVFSSCANLIRTLPNQIHDEVNVEDLHKNDDDHACDTLRYLMQGFVRQPVRPPTNPALDPDRWVWEQMAKRGNDAGAHPVLGRV